MKTVLCAAIGLGLMASSSLAARVNFLGAACITSVTPECTVEGWDVGQCFEMRYRPPNLGDNGPITSIGFAYDFAASNFTLGSGSLVGTTYRTVTSTHIFSITRQFPASMRLTKQTPSDLTTAQSISVIGNIKDFDVPNCTLQFKGSVQRRP